ncbi:MAG: alpha/beta fold hydrolase [Candidatus Nanopelagicales bacterium]
MTQLVEIQGEPLAVQVYEPLVRKGDALFVHGYTGSKEDFLLLAPLLAQRGYRVVTTDNRGQHESPHSAREDAYTIPSLARDAVALADHFGLERPHLLGHSFGGLVAQRAAVLAPERWGSLTLFCTGPGAVPAVNELALSLELLQTRSMAQLWEEYRDADARMSPMYEITKKRWLMSDPRSMMTHARHLMTEPSIVDQVRATGLSVHVVYGENDDAWPLAEQDEMARQLSAPVSVIKDAGHCPNEDQPELTAQVLTQFWDGI